MEEVKNIEEYLEYVGRFRENDFGRRFRRQFRDLRGTAELAMLSSPSEKEYGDFCRAVEVMTAEEKRQPEELSDADILVIARRAEADSANVSIFINGYVLARKKGRINSEE